MILSKFALNVAIHPKIMYAASKSIVTFLAFIHFKVDFKVSVSSIYNRFLQRIVANVGEAKWSLGEEFDFSVGRK